MKRHILLVLLRLPLAGVVAVAMPESHVRWGMKYPGDGQDAFGFLMTFFMISMGAALLYFFLGTVGQILLYRKPARITVLVDLTLFMLLAGLLVDIGVTAKYVDKQPQNCAAEFFPVTPSDHKFLAEILNALHKNDDAWIAKNMSYPLSIETSKGTQIVNTKEEFAPVLAGELTKAVRVKIEQDAQQPLFKNWKGVMIGDGILWFTEYVDNGPTFRIQAIGFFAWQTHEPIITNPDEK